MSLEEVISTYGYAAIGIGTFLEGETILVMGGFAAHRGFLELPWVIVSAFLGTLFGDQLYYYIGRIKGKRVLESRPYWKSKSEQVLLLLDRHQTWLILGFRFIYGMRTITPFLIGVSRITPIRFLILNILGAFLWAVVIGTLGYTFGYTIELVFGNIKRYELLCFAVLAGIGTVMWLIHFLQKRPLTRKALQSTPKSGVTEG